MRANSLLSSLAVLLSVFFLAGCAPPPPDIKSEGPVDAQGRPELTQAVIEERINEARVFDVMPESGTGEPISWSFDEDEPKEITVVDRQDEGDKVTITLDIKTESSPRARIRRQLAGRIRTEWLLETGWVLRRWEIVHTENLSMKYRDLPKPSPDDNANAPKPEGP